MSTHKKQLKYDLTVLLLNLQWKYYFINGSRHLMEKQSILFDTDGNGDTDVPQEFQNKGVS